jgi:DNA replicative helicase MCM subunit Mcm2 (Cdc46/Mcm family)
MKSKQENEKINLPTWIMEKAYDYNYGMMQQKEDYRAVIKIYKNLLKRKNISKINKRYYTDIVQRKKKALREFKPLFFNIKDVKELNNIQLLDELMRTVATTARQLEALVRFTEVSAKVRLSDKVTKANAKRVKRNRIVVVKKLIEELENKIGKTISLDELIKKAKAKGIKEDEFDDIIYKLIKRGDIFQTKPNFIQTRW